MIDVVHVAGKEYDSVRYSFVLNIIYDKISDVALISNVNKEPDFNSDVVAITYRAYMYASHLNDENISYLFEINDYLTNENNSTS